MIRRDRLRLWVVVIVVLAALAYAWPVVGRLNMGLDLKGGAHIVLQAKDTPEAPVEKDSIDRLLAVLRNRVDQYGVAEPIIQKNSQKRFKLKTRMNWISHSINRYIITRLIRKANGS